MLQQELDVAREQLKHLQKHHDEFEMKSKTDMKLLVKEVKSLRSSQLELKQQLSELMEEKVDVEVWCFLVLICYNYELIILDISLNQTRKVIWLVPSD